MIAATITTSYGATSGDFTFVLLVSIASGLLVCLGVAVREVVVWIAGGTHGADEPTPRASARVDIVPAPRRGQQPPIEFSDGPRGPGAIYSDQRLAEVLDSWGGAR